MTNKDAAPGPTTTIRLAAAIVAVLASGFTHGCWALADMAGVVSGDPLPMKPVKPAEPPADKITDAVKPAKMTPEQIRAAIEEAKKHRMERSQPDPAVSDDVAKALAEQWGVEVIGISRTAGGYMLDFRFRVVDAEKALPLFDHRIKPYVLAEHSQIKLPVPMAPKVGAFRPTNRGKNIKAEKTYYMVFGNPDSYLKPGQKVSVVIGDFRVEHLTVQ